MNYQDFEDLLKELSKKNVKSFDINFHIHTKEGWEAFDKAIKEYWGQLKNK